MKYQSFLFSSDYDFIKVIYRTKKEEPQQKVLFLHALINDQNELILHHMSRLHPGVDLADLELPQAANLDGGHAALFDPAEDRIAVDAEIGSDFLHGNPTFWIVFHFCSLTFTQYTIIQNV